MQMPIVIVILSVAIGFLQNPIQSRAGFLQSNSTPAASTFSNRHALVMGNSKYGVGTLRNPANDAQDMARALRKLGFEVTMRIDLSKDDMKKEIRAFGKRLSQTGGTGLFYYAGHGIQVENRNYLVPIEAMIAHEELVEYEAVDAGLVLAEMTAAMTHLNIIILDACRNNPFALSFRSPTRGLAVMSAPKQRQTLIAYSTSPNNVADDGLGRNGTYTEELLRKLETPGLKIEDLFKRVRTAVRGITKGAQIPWESSSLEDDFYFNPIDECAGSEVIIGRGQRRLEMQLPKGWKRSEDALSIAQAAAYAEEMFGAQVSVSDLETNANLEIILVECCDSDTGYLAILNISLTQQDKPFTKETLRRLSSGDAREALSQIFLALSQGAAKTQGIQMRMIGKPQTLSPAHVEGARVTYQATKDGETMRGVFVVCRNLVDDHSLLVLSGGSDSDGVAKLESIVDSIIRR